MIDVLFRKLLCNLPHKIVYSGYFFMGGEFLQLSMIMWNFSWRKLCVRPNWASPTHSGSSTTCWCCTFLSYPTRKHSYHLQRAHYLLAAVHATVKCVQTAQPKEGGKGEVCTIKLEQEASWDMSLVYLWKPVGLLYAHAPLCTICMMGTTLTGTDSISHLLAAKILPTSILFNWWWFCEDFVFDIPGTVYWIELKKWMLNEVWKWLDVPCMHQLPNFLSISESVDTLCRNGADAQYMQYLRKSRIISPQIR